MDVQGLIDQVSSFPYEGDIQWKDRGIRELPHFYIFITGPFVLRLTSTFYAFCVSVSSSFLFIYLLFLFFYYIYIYIYSSMPLALFMGHEQYNQAYEQ